MDINQALTQLREDSEATQLPERVIELRAMLRLCELLDQTGECHVPALIYGALLALYGRASFEHKADQASHTEVFY
jgi:hypothetical protein